MSTEIVPFAFQGAEVRTVTIDGEPWFVAADVTDLLGYTNGRMSVAAIPDRMKSSVTISDGTSGNPNRAILNEAGVNRLIMRSTLPNAERIQDWLAEDVMPSIRKTGSYVAPVAPRSEMDIIREQHAAIGTLLEQNEAVVARAVAAESFKAAIEVADGLTPREFNKHYLSDLGERAFFQILYTSGLLIDQRGQRFGGDGKPKSGKQHSHPSFTGKAYFYLHPTVDRDGNRFENTRVRPGAPELALVEYFAKRGFTPNTNSDRALEAVR
jgi:prophage antirepressor-like protein